MNSHITRSFRDAFRTLPPEVRERSRRAYRLWRENPYLPGLRFKRVGADVSIRIGRDYRALGLLEGENVYWYWIGSHDDYERML